MDRRDALKKLGMGGATVLGASAVMSSPAFADSGSVSCRYSYTTASTASISITRPTNGQVRIVLSATAPGGACGCGDTPIVRYVYSYVLTDSNQATAQSTDYSLATLSIDSGPLTLGQGNSNIAYDVQVGVRIQCPGGTLGPAYVCRFVTESGSAKAPITFTNVPLSATSSANLPGC
jgi:hypothetical protein